MASKESKVKSGKNSRIKQYMVWTGDNLTSVYEAPEGALDGAVCLLTTYEYSGTQIIKMKETDSTWVAATMDI